MWVGSLGPEDPLEEGIATHSNILAWRIPWTEEHGRLPFIGPKQLDMTEENQHACTGKLLVKKTQNYQKASSTTKDVKKEPQ